jgi:peptidoglycan/LPS O-acetylase OafA/YrhL
VLIHYLGASFDRTYLATDARFDSMLFGCCLAVAGNPALDLPKKEKPSVLDLCMLVVGVVALLGSFTIRNTEFRETLRYSMQGLALYPIFLTTVRFPNWGPIRFLNLRAIRYLGTISYSLYLVHHIVIQSVERFALGTDITVFLALSLSIALSSCSWFLLEKPCAALRKRLTEVHR